MVRSRLGVSLLELVVTCFIVLALLALLLPAIHSVREAARAAKCQSNARQVNLAVQQHCAQTSRFPGNSPKAWSQSLLPYLEADYSNTVEDGVSVFLCPSREGDFHNACDFAFNYALAQLMPTQISDGTSNTICLGEVYADFGGTLKAGPLIVKGALGSQHAAKYGTAFGDGSVRWLNESIDELLLDALLSPSGGELIDFQ